MTRIDDIKELIFLNGRRLFNATDRKSKEAFKRRQTSLYSALIQEERYQERKAEEEVRELLTGP